jgi:mannitol-1-phosphate/altronate dehydrogenase
VSVLSCDNLAGNGTQTARLVREFSEALPRAERDELVNWLGQDVPETAERITSGRDFVAGVLARHGTAAAAGAAAEAAGSEPLPAA